ncbi:SRPBCC family protein [Janibacter melonis]|uniref:SRPBCC family protein n=1 Tax=Janibacter melonis TaxID=262209 RepID=UPI001E3BFC3F|nr:SRPBCC family protein [Janibacter melonis]MCB5993079.1 SRPBCC family protein [Janibacter melonis]
MRTVSRWTPAGPDAVWSVLADGWTYPGWVVGASRMRAVTPGWPGAGARLHHSVGSWPWLLDDETSVREVDPGRRLVLRARATPLGAARVEITLHPQAQGTRVEMREDAESGPSLLLPSPARQLGIVLRNREALRRLALLAERAGRATG